LDLDQAADRLWVLPNRDSTLPYLEHRKRRIYFEDTGDGPALILGHIFLSSTEMWCEQPEVVSEAILEFLKS
jgi:hypothetical protein